VGERWADEIDNNSWVGRRSSIRYRDVIRKHCTPGGIDLDDMARARDIGSATQNLVGT
jgi:hypothetical protein